MELEITLPSHQSHLLRATCGNDRSRYSCCYSCHRHRLRCGQVLAVAVAAVVPARGGAVPVRVDAGQAAGPRAPRGVAVRRDSGPGHGPGRVDDKPAGHDAGVRGPRRRRRRAGLLAGVAVGSALKHRRTWLRPTHLPYEVADRPAAAAAWGITATWTLRARCVGRAGTPGGHPMSRTSGGWWRSRRPSSVSRARCRRGAGGRAAAHAHPLPTTRACEARGLVEVAKCRSDELVIGVGRTTRSSARRWAPTARIAISMGTGAGKSTWPGSCCCRCWYAARSARC